MRHSPPRGRWLLAVGASLVAALAPAQPAGSKPAVLPAWTTGHLDIHHIATGRGNAALVIGPDGTSTLIDAGAGTGNLTVTTPPRPDGTRRPGEWIARYARRHLRATNHSGIDYFVSSHLHPDHIGDVGAGTPPSPTRPSYLLTGVTEVAESLPIGLVIDRGYPDYSYPTRWSAGFAKNYFAFIAAREKAGEPCERVRVGADDQLRLRHAPAKYPTFRVRNISANGVTWTGQGNDSTTRVPSLAGLEPADYPDENMCSISILVSYGSFDYFTGGDLHCDTRFGRDPWRDIETPAARAAGAVEVATANHHGYFDAVGADSVRALQPRVWVVPVWHITHMNMAVLERMLSERLYAGARDVFATDLMPATALMNERFMGKVASSSGHVVIRVSPGGEEFFVYITGNEDETDSVKAMFGPYRSRAAK